jgi:general secretion pathway protein I
MNHGIRGSGIRICKRGRRALGRPDESRIPDLKSRRQHGFSLLEVIAAIMLLAIAFAALMKVAGSSISLSQNAAEHSEAAMRARSLLDSAFVGEPLKVGSQSGQFDSRFRWQLDVTPWTGAGVTPPSAPLHLYQLDLDVMWGPGARPRSAHFRTLRLSGPLTDGLDPFNHAQASR